MGLQPPLPTRKAAAKETAGPWWDPGCQLSVKSTKHWGNTGRGSHHLVHCFIFIWVQLQVFWPMKPGPLWKPCPVPGLVLSDKLVSEGFCAFCAGPSFHLTRQRGHVTFAHAHDLLFPWYQRAMTWCLKRCCQHLLIKWRTLSFMNCLRCLQCAEWKGGTGCGSPTGSIWKCVCVWRGRKRLVLAVECERNPLLTAATLHWQWHLCVSVQVKRESKEFWKRGKASDRMENLATLRIYFRTHISPSFEAAHNKFKQFPHALVMGLKSFRSGRD